MSTRFGSGAASESFLIEIFSQQPLGYRVESYGSLNSLTPLRSEFAGSEPALVATVNRILVEHFLTGKTFAYKYLEKAT